MQIFSKEPVAHNERHTSSKMLDGWLKNVFRPFQKIAHPRKLCCECALGAPTSYLTRNASYLQLYKRVAVKFEHLGNSAVEIQTPRHACEANALPLNQRTDFKWKPTRTSFWVCFYPNITFDNIFGGQGHLDTPL